MQLECCWNVGIKYIFPRDFQKNLYMSRLGLLNTAEV